MKKNNTLTKLYLLVITIPKGKKEIMGEMLDHFDITANLVTLARGGMDSEFNKEVMFCIVKEDKMKDAMLKIQDKFTKFRSNITMAYAIPLYNIMGVSNYIALTKGGIR